jgi:UDP-glucuronate 4-epimerase
MSKKILITGAAGFIGFHLARHLHLGGNTVVGLDNFNDYYSPQLKRDRCKELAKHQIEVIEGDICQPAIIKDVIIKHQITHLVHLAAQAGVRYSLVNPQAYVKSNLEGFVNILEMCRQHSYLKLIYASSSSVYGTNDKIPFSVEDRTDHPASLYGATKKANELMAAAYHHLHGISVTGLRFFTVYGPWGRPDMAYYAFTKAILEGTPIEVYNDGRMKRDFTYIDDIVQGITAAIDLEAPCEIFNLGNQQPEELLTFIEVIEECLGKKAIKRSLPMQPGDVVTTFADISHSRKKLGFAPKTSLKEGIPFFIDWYLNYIHN